MTVIIYQPQPFAVPTTFGTPGPPGPPGTGSTIAVSDEGTDLGSSFTRLRFTGAGATASNAGGGVAQIDIPGGGITGVIDASTYGFVEGLASGANAAANATAWAALKTALIAQAVNSDGANLRGLPEIRFPLGTYEFSAPLDLNFGQVIIEGHGSGASGLGASTRLKFYNSTGIRIQDSNTSGASTKDGTTHFSGTESRIRNLAIEGSYSSGAEAEYHGVHARTTFYAENVHVTGFHGDGYRIEADNAGSLGGNASSWRIVGGRSWGNRNGIYVDGADANVGTAIGLRTDLNRRAGIFESSLLGSAYVGCETSSNGILGGNDGVTVAATCVAYDAGLGAGTKTYGVIVGQDAWASTHPPSGTNADNQGWYYRLNGGPSPGGPSWFSGILVRSGGAVICDTAGAYNKFDGCYAEFNQPAMQACTGTVVSGGALSDFTRQTSDAPAVLGAAGGGISRFQYALQVQSGKALVQLGATGNGGLAGSEYLFFATQPTYLANGIAMRIVAGAGVSMEVEGTAPLYYLSTQNTSWTFGRSTAPTSGVRIDPLFVGGAVNGRNITFASAAPTTGGPYAVGEIVFNNGAAAGGKVGWVCTTAGSPGTWKAFGVIDA
jgi:hypothetical protein